MSNNDNKSCAGTSLNCEEWANAKPSRKASKSVFIV